LSEPKPDEKPIIRVVTEEETKEVSKSQLRKNHFKEQTPVLISGPVIEHSKQKHQQAPHKTRWNTDDSAQDSWRIEYSDKGSDGDDIYNKKPIKTKGQKKAASKNEAASFDKGAGSVDGD
jgi:hypothetical protein